MLFFFPAQTLQGSPSQRKSQSPYNSLYLAFCDLDPPTSGNHLFRLSLVPLPPLPYSIPYSHSHPILPP